MTPKQIELARHALGLTSKRKVSYRNHYVTGEGNDDHVNWMAMVAGGEARRRSGSPLTGGDDCFWLTRMGAEQVLLRGEKLDPEDFPLNA